MKTWQIRIDTQDYVVSDTKMTMVEQLINGVGGTTTIESIHWDGDYAISIHGILSTDSIHVAKRLAKLIHSIGGRARLRKIDDRRLIGGGAFRPANRQRKIGGRHQVMTR